MIKHEFRNELGRNTFYNKYALGQNDSWPERSRAVMEDVTGTMNGRRRRLLCKDDQDELVNMMTEMKFMPGGRYIYYGGRHAHFFNNCYLLRAEEDTREEWGSLAHRGTDCLMTGGGIGATYDRLRAKGRPIRKTGGVASGPIALAEMLNGCGQNVMQGGARRSAIWGGLNWRHPDAYDWIYAKDWDNMIVDGTNGLTIGDLKRADFNYKAPLDMTNISLNYDDEFLDYIEAYGDVPEIFLQNVRMALMNGEPGMGFNFGNKSKEDLRNACCEVTSEDDSDVCNLGSANMANIRTKEEFRDIISLGSKFLVCGTLRADLPYDKVREVREQNRRLGMGLMGVHEWLLQRGYKYEMNDELREWMQIYEEETERSANEHCDRLYLNRPKGYRAIAPTGTIGILA